MNAARRRPKSEDDFVRENTGKEFAELRRNAEFFERFVAYAATKLGIAERLIIGRLRMTFCGRTPPASFALLVKEFFRSGAHFDLVEEVDSGIRFQAKPAYMARLKKFIFALPKVERITRVICVNRMSLSEGIHIFVHVPDQRGTKATPTIEVSDPERKHVTLFKNAFWDQFRVWPDWVDWDNQRHSIFVRKNSDDFDPLEIAPDGPSEDDKHDNILSLKLTAETLEVLFKGENSWAGHGYASPGAFWMCLDVIPETQRKPVPEDAPVNLANLVGDFDSGWAHLWCPSSHVPAALRSAGAKARAILGRRLAGVRRRYEAAKPFLTVATIDDLDPGLNTDLLAARRSLAAAWAELVAANKESLEKLVRDLWNDSSLPLHAKPRNEAKPSVPDDVSEPEAVAFLERVAPYDLESLTVVSRIVHGFAPAKALKASQHRGGISLAAAVKILARGATDHIGVAEGFTLGTPLYVALSAVFNVSFFGDPDSRESQMLIGRKEEKIANPKDPVRFFIRNRISAGEMDELKLALVSFIEQRRRDKENAQGPAKSDRNAVAAIGP